MAPIHRLLPLLIAAALAPLALAPPARAAIVLNFETNPNLPPQPNNFIAAGAMQTIAAKPTSIRSTTLASPARAP